MALTKSQARTMVREWLDDPQAKRWTDARIDLVIQMVLDDLYTDMLDVQSGLTSQLQTISSLYTPGYIDLRLATQGGMLAQRFYRLQHVTRDGREYRPVDARDVLISESTAIIGPDSGYYVMGDQLWLFPLDTASAVEIRYSFKPMPFTSLLDGSYVPFPEGSESAYVLLASAISMAKGGAEDVKDLMLLAQQSRDRCLFAIRRQYHGMMVPFTMGTAIDVGGI